MDEWKGEAREVTVTPQFREMGGGVGGGVGGGGKCFVKQRV